MGFDWPVPMSRVLRYVDYAAVGGPLPPHGPPPNGLEVRSPMVEQLGAQLGSGLSRDERRLSVAEIAVARSVFHRAVQLEPVRVVTTEILSSPTTMGNVIRIKPFDPSSGQKCDLDQCTLVHELTHVWQFQTRGAAYMSNSLWRQGLTEGRDRAYMLKASQLRYIRSMMELSAERQARVVELYFVSTLLRSPDDAQELRARLEFSRVTQDLSDIREDPDLFWAECRDLDRLIEDVRRARLISSEYLYGESLGAHPAPHGQADAFAPPIMPIVRIDF